MRAAPRRDQPRHGLQGDGMALHDAEAAEEPDERDIVGEPKRGAHGPRVAVGPPLERVDAARQRHHTLGLGEAGGQVLAANGLAHRHHQRGGLPVKPAIERVGTHGLHDVTGPHERPRRPGQAVGEGGQPVLLAAMGVDHVDLGEPLAQPPQIGGVAGRIDAARQPQGLDAADARRPRALDHAGLGAAPAGDDDLVAGPLELHAHAGGPVRVGRPAAARHELEDLHARVRRRASTRGRSPPPARRGAPG